MNHLFNETVVFFPDISVLLLKLALLRLDLIDPDVLPLTAFRGGRLIAFKILVTLVITLVIRYSGRLACLLLLACCFRVLLFCVLRPVILRPGVPGEWEDKEAKEELSVYSVEIQRYRRRRILASAFRLIGLRLDDVGGP